MTSLCLAPLVSVENPYTMELNQHKSVGTLSTHTVSGFNCYRPSDRHGPRDRIPKGRNVRSKCQCSCVLQFTVCHAFCCVLHRPTSQVIHHSGYLYIRWLMIKFFSHMWRWLFCHVHRINDEQTHKCVLLLALLITGNLQQNCCESLNQWSSRFALGVSNKMLWVSTTIIE